MKLKSKNILDILLILSILIYVFFAYKNELIPFRYQLIAFGVIALLFFIGFLMRNKIVKGLIIVLVLIVSLMHLKAQDMLGKIFVSGSDPQPQSRISQLSLIKMTDNTTSESEAVYGTSSQLDKELYEFMFESIATEYKIVPNIINVISDIDLANQLVQGQVDIMILDEANREAILEEFPSFNEVTQVIKTYEKEIILESSAVKVNPSKESFAVLLTGADSWGDPNEDGPGRTDVNIIAIVNPRIDQILLVSVPRDTYVPLSCGNDEYDKLSHAGMYGLDCQIGTLENFLDIDINYYMKVNFGSVLNVINIIGGSINVYNPYAFQGHTEEYYFEEGCLNLDGLATLNYIRTRYELPDGDFGRQENQKRVIKSLLEKMTSPHRILNMGNMFDALSKEVETNVDVKFVNQFISNQLDKWPSWGLNSLLINGYDDEQMTYSFPGQYLYVFQPNQDELDQTIQNIKDFMTKSDISQIAFMNPDPQDPIETEEQPNETTEPSQELVVNNYPVQPKYYLPIVDNTIEKFGIVIRKFDLQDDDQMTKEQYIQACEASYSW